MRKVIQISDGVYLCDDGTMWAKVDASTAVENSVIWTQLDDVPQSENKLPTGKQIHDAYKKSLTEPCDCRKNAGWVGANPMFKCKHTKD